MARTRERLTEAEARARRERLEAMGTVEQPTTAATITTFTKRAVGEFDESAPERDDDGSGVVE